MKTKCGHVLGQSTPSTERLELDGLIRVKGS